jgi:hypothetical protein
MRELEIVNTFQKSITEFNSVNCSIKPAKLLLIEISCKARHLHYQLFIIKINCGIKNPLLIAPGVTVNHAD